MEGGGNDGPPGGHGGDGGDGGGDSDPPFNSENMSSEEKYLLKGYFAKQCLKHFMPPNYFLYLESNPRLELQNVQ